MFAHIKKITVIMAMACGCAPSTTVAPRVANTGNTQPTNNVAAYPMDGCTVEITDLSEYQELGYDLEFYAYKVRCPQLVIDIMEAPFTTSLEAAQLRAEQQAKGTLATNGEATLRTVHVGTQVRTTPLKNAMSGLFEDKEKDRRLGG